MLTFIIRPALRYDLSMTEILNIFSNIFYGNELIPHFNDDFSKKIPPFH